ncbi:uncharacterized protein B0T23DRAFT_216898 [Neurospora hispaniola]|uniref:Uncharacterized protein n=1 Tax=Neurospora hispaniola TaxID=588809 RepID=A0AAJ0I2G2_9PEZI|nr:hypothetical protein B0T23DRAFT_216898 [Neurospora hispaniola]
MAPVITRMAFCLGNWTSKRWKDVLHHCGQSFILGQIPLGLAICFVLLFLLSSLPSSSSSSSFRFPLYVQRVYVLVLLFRAPDLDRPQPTREGSHMLTGPTEKSSLKKSNFTSVTPRLRALTYFNDQDLSYEASNVVGLNKNVFFEKAFVH